MVQETSIIIPGPVGSIEAVLTGCQPGDTLEQLAIVCHPHPLFGGTMNNKVVVTLVRAYRDKEIPSIRFNFRGVGASDGTYDDGIGETDDFWAVYQWAQEHMPSQRMFIAGFSFGSYVASRGYARLAERENQIPEHLLLIAPAVSKWDFSEVFPLPGDIWVVMGDADEVVPPEAVFEWVESVYPPIQLLRMEGASHFFHKRLSDLKQLVTQDVLA